MRRKHNLYVYTSFCEFILNFDFLILDSSEKHTWNLYDYYLLHVSSFLFY